MAEAAPISFVVPTEATRPVSMINMPTASRAPAPSYEPPQPPKRHSLPGAEVDSSTRAPPPSRPPPSPHGAPPSRPPPRPPSLESLPAVNEKEGEHKNSPATSRRGPPPAPPAARRSTSDVQVIAAAVIQPLRGDESRVDWVTKMDVARILKTDGFPFVIRECLDYLYKPQALCEEGIFRVSGSHTQILDLDRRYREDGVLDLESVKDPNVVAGLLKLQLAHTNEPPIPRQMQEQLVKLSSTGSIQERCESTKTFIQGLRPHERAQMMLMTHLFCLICLTPENNMQATNLALSTGPSVFAQLAVSSAQNLLKFLLDYPAAIFGDMDVM